MADNSLIEWCDSTANAINGCSVLSPGCTNCYAMRLAGTRMKNHPTRKGLTQPSKAGPVWTGEVRFHEPALLQPLRWQRPRSIFWNAHGDTFHENVPDGWVDKVFAVCALTPQHRHMILTKRSDRMREYMSDGPMHRWMRSAETLPGNQSDNKASVFGRPMPLPNVWLGVSVEDQPRADERREDFEATPAAVKFVSYEPAIGPVDWSGWEFVDQMIAGGESGPDARPPHPEWFRDTRDFCIPRGIAFFFKQWGEWLPAVSEDTGDRLVMWPDDGRDIEQLTEDWGWHRVQRLPGQEMWRVGKKRAGRLLDGVEHNGFPWKGESNG